MKNLFVFALLLIGSLQQVQAQAQNDFFDKYRDDERFTVVDLKKQLLDMVESLDVEGNDELKAAMKITKEIKSVQILNTSDSPEAFFKEAQKSIASQNYESMLTIRTQDGDNVNILSRNAKGGSVEDLLILIGGDEFALIRIDGSIDLSRLSELSKLGSLGGNSSDIKEEKEKEYSK